MTLLLQIPPDTEAKLLERAAATGKGAEAVAADVLRESLATDDASPMLPLEEWHARFNALIAAMPRGNPSADFNRESIYDGRGE
jgi:plasmid stability protein